MVLLRPGSSRRLIAALAGFALVMAACGGAGTPSAGNSGDPGGPGDVSAPEDEGTPERGGEVVYAVEAETSGGFCLPEAQLAAAGMQVARSIYETLTAPNEDGEYVPYLAESVEPNATFDQWTITLRDGVTFHDGTALTAEVVKNNLDAYRGEYRDAAGNRVRNPLLFVFVFQNIADVAVVDPLTVTVTTKTPWPALPAFLHTGGRIGIMAQAQLDDPDSCGSALVGTGPFVLDEWVVNDHLSAERNADYWQSDADGTQLPYLDAIEFRPTIEDAQRFNSLEAGEVDALHSTNALQLENVRTMAEAGTVNVSESEAYAEVGYGMLNASVAPFDNVLARRAMAFAGDRGRLNQLRNDGQLTVASGPFAPGSVGYLDDAGFPEFDLDEARRLVDEYEETTGQELAFTLSHATGPDTVARAQLVKEMAEEAGATVTLRQSEQAQLINQAIGGEFQAMVWRNHPCGDPDLQYDWWHSGSPANFPRIDDPEIDRLLEEGRVSTDSAERREIYEELNRRFADQAYNLWAEWTRWMVVTGPEVHGVLGPDLPDGSGPFPGLATGHPTVGLWVEDG
ncbi:ABC transporter substrate-binding protein [soil metagenome]